ncbi:GSCOCT00007053001.2-RA-CDS [Cotesia congregata]|uniref:Scabrous FRED protein n=1 Tax=Cotesia congregata TaxID=51543 RepID=A0A8J2H7K7_COTCN|nr:GSCOCT00007053001.2-RA-CDS [Cotesia congregata]CAG5082487.1 scabrous FRED protein [Cotesia congregata]
MECLKWMVFLLLASAFENVYSSVPSSSSLSSEELASAVKLLSEQVNALLDHRQEDYNSLDSSLKKAIEENTELMVLRNEVKQLRKEVTGLRGGSGNEAKNERLRIKWLGSAVTELKSELAEVLRTQNASEELAQRALIKSELSLLRGDIAQVGRGIRDLGGRLTRIEASLGSVRDDITAVKERAGQLTRSCADVASQLSTVQIEMKSLKWEPTIDHKHHQLARNEIHYQDKHDHHRSMRHSFSRSQTISRRIEDRLTKLEHKIALVSRKRAMVEKRVVYEPNPESADQLLDSLKSELSARLENVTSTIKTFETKLEELSAENLQAVETLEDKQESLQSEMKRALSHIDLNAARKNAELSLTREELSNLRKTVQALSVSASKLQEKSDLQQEISSKLTKQLSELNLTSSVAKAINVTHELEHVEDQYRLMVDALPGNCHARDGLTLLGVGQGAPLLVSCHEGWIVVARRVDGVVDFDRSWSEYASGFGSPVSEFWVGNEALHRLTRDNCTRLKIDLTDIYGSKWYANYEYFNVQSEETGYQLHVGGYSGNATDAFTYQNGMAFSAKDRDMDISTADCAANYHGGWWFSHCQHANLNARYSLGLTWYQSDTNEWMAVAAATMSIQRKEECSHN